MKPLRVAAIALAAAWTTVPVLGITFRAALFQSGSVMVMGPNGIAPRIIAGSPLDPPYEGYHWSAFATMVSEESAASAASGTHAAIQATLTQDYFRMETSAAAFAHLQQQNVDERYEVWAYTFPYLRFRILEPTPYSITANISGDGLGMAYTMSYVHLRLSGSLGGEGFYLGYGGVSFGPQTGSASGWLQPGDYYLESYTGSGVGARNYPAVSSSGSAASTLSYTFELWATFTPLPPDPPLIPVPESSRSMFLLGVSCIGLVLARRWTPSGGTGVRLRAGSHRGG